MTIALLVWLGMNVAAFFSGTIGCALEHDRNGVLIGTFCFIGNAFFFFAVLMQAIR